MVQYGLKTTENYSMCGRFALESSAQELADYFNVEVPAIFQSRYNIAPTTPVLARTEQELTFFSWGLVPGWARDVRMGHRMFNARAETVAEKPSFRSAFKRRRCLVPATGFYEWKAEQGAKQPYFCHLGHRLFSFAGIWEHWQDEMGNELQSCAILTAQSIGAMQAIHDRMPLVIREQDRAKWMDHRNEQVSAAMECIAQPDHEFEVYPVSKKVNSARNDSADLVKALM
jgi:putative SOS response-associated peptidase YedK